MKVLTRFRQGGGLRLARAFIRMGLLPDLLKAGLNTLLKGKSYKQQYAILRKKVEPKLVKEFNSFLVDSDKRINELEHKTATNDCNKYVWFCWLQGIENAPHIVKLCLESQKKWHKDRTFVIITADNY